MEYLVTAKEMRAYDTYTIEHIGLPALVLMERAALAVAQCVIGVLGEKPGKVLCVCGTGNNGGDGLGVARLLLDRGIEAEVALIGDAGRATKETQVQLSVLKQYGIIPYTEVPSGEYTVVVDALFGTGLSREVTGIHKQAIEAMNAKNACRVAIDIPSGIDTDTGAVWGTAVKADITLTLAYKKRGLFLYPGAAFTGIIRLADIGITERSFQGKLPSMYTIKEKPGELLPKRRADGNKGTFGKLLLVAGSEKMAGAALLCGESAYRMGAGMIKLVIPEKIREIVQERLPEALIQTYESPTGLQEEEEKLFLENSKWADAIAIGPGLSVCESGRRLLALAISQKTKPLVIDADGLNILSSNKQLMEQLRKRCAEFEKENAKVILTPHMGELARLLGEPLTVITADETLSTIRLAESTGCIVAGKSARTHVCEADHPIFLNTAGNDRMATAGSGDVLAGMIASLLVQGMEPLKAAVTGVYLHACAGDKAAEKAGNVGIKASDIIAGFSLL